MRLPTFFSLFAVIAIPVAIVQWLKIDVEQITLLICATYFVACAIAFVIYEKNASGIRDGLQRRSINGILAFFAVVSLIALLISVTSFFLGVYADPHCGIINESSGIEAVSSCESIERWQNMLIAVSIANFAGYVAAVIAGAFPKQVKVM